MYKYEIKYRHSIPAPVDRMSASACFEVIVEAPVGQVIGYVRQKQVKLFFMRNAGGIECIDMKYSTDI